MNFKETLKYRRSYYHLTNSSPVSDEAIREILEFGLLHVPSAFNSQSTRVVLLLGEHHKKLWMITKEILRKMARSAEDFTRTEAKIDTSFAAGYGTVLFFEDTAVVKKLQASFPTYKESFPVWSQQTSAMHQLVIWTMLEDAGFGASLQHYRGGSPHCRHLPRCQAGGSYGKSFRQPVRTFPLPRIWHPL